MSDTTHECPISDCARRVPAGKLMCAPHWRRVPREVQREQYAAYRAWQRGDENGLERFDAATQASVHAVEVA